MLAIGAAAMTTVVAALAAAPSSSSSSGAVTYVTAKEVYLDVGSDDGVAVGAQLKVVRKKRAVATCEVVEVAPDKARCKSDRVYPGDRVVFTPGPKPAAEPSSDKHEHPPPPKEQIPDDVDMAELRKAVIEGAPVPKVQHKRDEGGVVSARANALLAEQIWSISTGDRTFARSYLDANFKVTLNAIPGVPLYASADARVYGDLLAPSFQRSGQNQLVELYVYDAEIGVDRGPVVGALGRFRPRIAPGVPLIDGAQAGARFGGDGDIELGAYAGSVPDLLTGAPGFVYVTAGFYGGAVLEPVAGLIVVPRARAAVTADTTFAVAQGELEASAEATLLRQVEAGISTRLVTAQPPDFLPTIDDFRADAAYFGFDPVRIAADYRYIRKPTIDFDSLLGAINPLDESHQASSTATWNITPEIGVGLTGGFIYEIALDFDLTRGYVGPTLSLPQAFGGVGGLDVGYIEELGGKDARPGRSAYLTARLTPLYASRDTLGAMSGLSVVARVSYLDETALGDPFREAGLMTLVDAPLLPWLSLRGRFYLEQALGEIHGAARAAPSVINGDVGVAGGF